MSGRLVCAVDVGTGSARAGIFDRTGELLGRGEHAILTNRPSSAHAEHDSEDIWRAVCAAVRQARSVSGAKAEDIGGIAFDATCSLVARDANDRQVSVSLSGESRWDTIAWFDHRAIAEAEECSATGHRVLDHLGGSMSPEMQTPKLMWLKRKLPESWSKAARLFDLSDFLSFRATGNRARSQCTLASKWTYLAHEEPGWQHEFLDAVGIGDLIERAGLPERASQIGTDLGPLSSSAAGDLGLSPSCRVGAGFVDAYAGALAVLSGIASHGQGELDHHAALIAGTSSCVMALSGERRSFASGWGPFFGVTLPDLWTIEGGQSATGALLDHLIQWHGAGGEPDAAMHRKIAERITALREIDGVDFAGRLHLLPDFHGNRTPFADPNALGVISGLPLDASFDSLCRLYWRACVSIALGVRQVVDAFNGAGFSIRTLHLAGGHIRNPILVELYADATGCTIVEPQAEETVLLGTAMAAASASGLFPTLSAASDGMRRPGKERAPNLQWKERYDRDYRAFIAMHRHRQELDAI